MRLAAPIIAAVLFGAAASAGAWLPVTKCLIETGRMP